MAKHAPDCTPTNDLFACQTCGHFGCWHQLDDSLNVSPVDSEAKFRCLGEDFGGCDVSCPAFIGVVSVKRLEHRNIFDKEST